MGYVTELDFARVRHKPTGKEGLVIPELCGWRCVSRSRVQVVVDNGQSTVVQWLLIEELEVLEIIDPENVDKSLFSIVPSQNGRLKKG
ncbi:MAG: hypothetical protein Q8Q95_03550 [bacterium]|nr:hypothetical protein [bacterium]